MLKVYEVILFGIIPTILGFHFIGLFIDDDSRYKKYKFKQAIECIMVALEDKRRIGIKRPTIDFMYKDKHFEVGIHKDRLNCHYSIYTIFINGEEAANYHELEHIFRSTYYYETLNHRHRDEVTDIIKYACKRLKKSKKMNSTVKETPNYSYFK